MRAIALLLWLAGAAAAQPPPRTPEILREFDALARPALWPGFEPARTPLALAEQGRTTFARHPNPPEDFDGVRANTSARINGVMTATLMVHPERPAREQAAVLIHECFHVFQRERHPKWSANEADLFTYPVEDIEAQTLALLETEALRRALAEGGGCWTPEAIRLRRLRFARLTAGAVAYERGTELNEGLAQYIEDLALGRREGRIPEGGFAPEDVRRRGYSSGQAWALLLDRYLAGWKERVAGSLDELLPELAVAECRFEDGERLAAARKAEEQVVALRERLARLAREAHSREGWTLRVVFPRERPAQLQGFDPMNVERLGGNEVLHKRIFRLGHGEGQMEVLNRESVTLGAGAHPLFQGVREIAVPGLPEAPSVEESAAGLVLKAPGVTASLGRGGVERSGRQVTVTLR